MDTVAEPEAVIMDAEAVVDTDTEPEAAVDAEPEAEAADDAEAVEEAEATPDAVPETEAAGDETGGDDGTPVEIVQVLDAEIVRGRPGDVEQVSIMVWAAADTDIFRDRMREVHAGFVDEPLAAVVQAQALVTEAVRALSDALLAEQLDLDPTRHTDNPDTEALRVALRGYRDFLERVLAL